MLIYVATFAGLLSAGILAAVYLADRYEREPVELIQASFLLGTLGQLVLILAVSALEGQMLWTGPWLVLTVAAAAFYMPFHVRGMAELDERFDGIVYTVALMAGATCVIHLNNLPLVAAASPWRAALTPDAAPGLRDLLILAAWPGFAAELTQGLVIIAIAVLVGPVLGTLHLQGRPPWRTAVTCAALGIGALGIDILAAGAWPARAALAAAAAAVAFAVKRRSVFRDRPQPSESDVLVLGVKTLLIVLGAALLATVLLQALGPVGQAPDESPLTIESGPTEQASGRR